MSSAKLLSMVKNREDTVQDLVQEGLAMKLTGDVVQIVNADGKLEKRPMISIPVDNPQDTIKEERKEQMSDCKCQKKIEESHIQRMLDKEYPGEGFKGITVPESAPLFIRIRELIEHADPDSEKDTDRKYKLLEISSVNGHDIAQIVGGNNGYHDWVKYFKDLRDIIHVLGQAGFDAWLIQLDNDPLCDIHYAYIGFRKLREIVSTDDIPVEVAETTGSPTLSQYLLDCGCDPEKYTFPRVFEKDLELFNSDMWSNTHVKHLELAEVAHNEYGNGGLVLLVGGNHEDGTTHWLSYLENIKYLLTRLREFGYQGWVCNIHNVVVSDYHEVILGYQKLGEVSGVADEGVDHLYGYAPAIGENPEYNHYRLTADIEGMDSDTWSIIRTFLAGIPEANVTADFDSITLVIDINTPSYERAVTIHKMLTEFLPKLFPNITGNITGLYRKQSQD